jgi:hypothetical protein
MTRNIGCVGFAQQIPGQRHKKDNKTGHPFSYLLYFSKYRIDNFLSIKGALFHEYPVFQICDRN